MQRPVHVSEILKSIDLVWWLEESGFLNATADSLPSPRARLGANILATGHGEAHDLHLRTLQAMGVTLVGHFLGADEIGARFAPDLAETMAWGDARYGDLMQLFRKTAAKLGLPDPQTPVPSTFDGLAPEVVPLDGFGAVIFAGGYRPDYRSWLPWHPHTPRGACSRLTSAMQSSRGSRSLVTCLSSSRAPRTRS